MCSRRRGFTSRAFTLVELLVVVGIITVLIAVLLPVLGKFREHANRIKCAANLRSVGQAMFMYTQRYGYYPGAGGFYSGFGGSTGGYGMGVWPVRLRPYLGGDQRVFRCPSRDERYEWSRTAAGPNYPPAGVEQTPFGYESGEPYIGYLSRFSYGYNAEGSNVAGPPGFAVPGSHRGLGIAFAMSVNGTRTGGEIAASKVRNAAELIVIADGQGTGRQDFQLFPFDGLAFNSPGDIHSGGANVLFCDGHVLWYPQVELILPENPNAPDTRTRYERIARMWNIDNRP